MNDSGAALREVLLPGEEAPLVADYKIEVFFLSDRSVWKDCEAYVTIWIAGSASEALTFWCIGPEYAESPSTFKELVWSLRRGRSGAFGCGKMIPPDYVEGGFATCPHCGLCRAAKRVSNIFHVRGSLDDLVLLLAHLYRIVGEKADFLVKYQRISRPELGQIIEDSKAGIGRQQDRLNRAPYDVEPAIYPLHRLVKDLAGGATLEQRLKAFLTS